MMKVKKVLLIGTMTAIMLTACGNINQSENADSEAKIIELENEIHKLNDINEIKLIQEQFANLADEKDASAQMDLFTDDAQLILNFGGTEMNLSGKEEIEEAFANTLNNTDILYHMNGQGTIQVDGDTATGVAYCRVVLIDTEEGITHHTDEGVRYTDEYVRQDGKWLISSRTSDFMFVDSSEAPAENEAVQEEESTEDMSEIEEATETEETSVTSEE